MVPMDQVSVELIAAYTDQEGRYTSTSSDSFHRFNTGPVCWRTGGGLLVPVVLPCSGNSTLVGSLRIRKPRFQPTSIYRVWRFRAISMSHVHQRSRSYLTILTELAKVVNSLKEFFKGFEFKEHHAFVFNAEDDVSQQLMS